MTDIANRVDLREDNKLIGGLPYILTIFLSAGLVFLVQPMFAKMALPVLGGSSSVWNVSLVCFQAALLSGYIYAHLLVKLNNVLFETIIHGVFLLLAALILPFGLTDALGVPDPASPTMWLIGVFMLSIAPAFAVISATAPLIQSWYSRSGRHDAADPYHLYAASNVGSLIGLMAYPIIMEPLLSLASQTMSWSLGYGVLAIGLTACGLLAWKTGSNKPATSASVADVEVDETENKTLQRLKWLALAFIPSSLLIGTTTHIVTDVASAPFLWAPPLMIYIASFIVVFSSAREKSLQASTLILPFIVAAVLGLMFVPQLSSISIMLVLGLDLAALAAASIVCHGMMAEMRPQASRLTEFYLLMSLGGVLGGAFNALLAPVIFNSAIEYPIMLAIVLLARPILVAKPKLKENYLPIAAVIVAVVAAGLHLASVDLAPLTQFALVMIPLFALILYRNEFVAAFASAAALCVTGMSMPILNANDVISERSFFGVVRTVTLGDMRFMMHGTTLHGAQFIDKPGAPTPITYYHSTTPIAQLFAASTHAKEVGVIGLGVGSTACLAAPNQSTTFFEIDPLVAKVALDPTRFTYLSECGQNASVVLGDGRITLQNEPAGKFGLILIDAFSSDAIPVHLLTIEAIEGYMSRLSDDGVVAFHITNRHIDLEPIVARAASNLGLAIKSQRFSPPESLADEPVAHSHLVIMSRDEANFASLNSDERWTPVKADNKALWTDDYSNILGAILATD